MMYSREFFSEQFRNADTDELLDRIAHRDLTEQAQQAIREILRSRGIDGTDLDQRILAAKRAAFRRSSPTNECDFCSEFAGISPVRDEGQKFCSIRCLHNARLHEVAVDVGVDDARDHARHIKQSPCPECGNSGLLPDMEKSHWVWAAVFYTRWGSESKLSCKVCARRNNLLSAAQCLLVGFFSVRGLFIAPAKIISNLIEIARRKSSPEPSAELVELARLQLADQILRARSQGKWALRP